MSAVFTRFESVEKSDPLVVLRRSGTNTTGGQKSRVQPQPAGIVRGNKQAAPPPPPPPMREREALINLYQIIMQQRREPPLIFILNKAAAQLWHRGRDIMETTEERESFGGDVLPIKAPAQIKLCHLHSAESKLIFCQCVAGPESKHKTGMIATFPLADCCLLIIWQAFSISWSYKTELREILRHTSYC